MMLSTSIPVLQSLDQAARKDLIPIKLGVKAAKFAKQTVNTQMKSFKRYGIFADWSNPYLTLDPKYKACFSEWKDLLGPSWDFRHESIITR
ncbi:putative isoleucine--tRNA ligase [Rosa chinensis]|uniref:Putative isoleucine--tRNA ligase n=1 Tax=Rosa chinensis TaxID=74649 RepID=A0A2P6S307_ROSCH|nr:isoleucine--tRNA ligase, chloroplastic/mitochondrial-like isoform X2 [Rosa chinensis]PRQ53045.1 putative isoleucine--tRNA ligase [Rosa chinensis]